MNKNVIIGLIVGGVLVLGGIAWYVSSSSNSDSASSFTAEEVTAFLNPYNQPVVMTATITDSADSTNDGTFSMQFQDDDTWSMTMNTSEGNIQVINDAGFTYMQNPEDGTWLKLPASDEVDSPSEDFKISDEDMEDFRTNAVATGTSDCSLGTCQTFDYTDPLSDEVSTMKISSDGRIAEIVAVTGTSTMIMTFDYDAPVDIQIPADAQEFSIPQ